MYASTKVSSEAKGAGAKKSKLRSSKKKRRTKGPSEKIRSLAALSLAPKVGYLQIGDLTGEISTEFEAFIKRRLPKKKFEEGEKIYPTDKAESMLCLVRKGSADIYRTSSLGQRFHIKQVEPGTMFGDMPAIGQSMLGAHAEAAEDTEVVYMSASDFETIATNFPVIGLNLARQIGPRLIDAETRHEQAAFQPVTARVAALLVRLANDSNQVVGYTHQEMADMLGVYRETVTNAIGELKQDKLIEVGRKRITLVDKKGLLKIHSF